MNNALFDARLKESLLLAATVDFAEVLSEPEDVEPEWTLRYRHQRKKMLENPNKWMRDKVRPVWKKTLQTAACLLLAASLTLGTLMAVSPTVRAAVINWVREFTGFAVIYQGTTSTKPIVSDKSDSSSFSGADTSSATQPAASSALPESNEQSSSPEFTDDTSANGTTVRVFLGEEGGQYVDIPVQTNTKTFSSAPAWAPTWLPDNWSVMRIEGSENNSSCNWLYQNGAGMLTFNCSQSSDSTVIVAGLTEENRQSVTVNGTSADYYEYEGYTYLFWKTESNFFSLQSGPYISPSKAQFTKIAESVQKVALKSQYALNWTSTGSHVNSRHDLPGGAWEEWSDSDNWYFWFSYISSDAGTLYIQGHDSQAVTVNGCAGTYWAASNERDETYGGTERIENDDGTIEIFHDPDAGQISTLTWKNSANVTFCIRGAFDQATLIRMAESVTKKS